MAKKLEKMELQPVYLDSFWKVLVGFVDSVTGKWLCAYEQIIADFLSKKM